MVDVTGHQLTLFILGFSPSGPTNKTGSKSIWGFVFQILTKVNAHIKPSESHMSKNNDNGF